MADPTSNQQVSYSATGDRFWYDANGVTRPATHRDIAGELERLHASIEDLQCEHDSLLRGRKPTHRCKVCGALWIDFGDSWSLFSRRCGQCCDNVAMDSQIEALPVIRPVETTADKWHISIGKALMDKLVRDHPFVAWEQIPTESVVAFLNEPNSSSVEPIPDQTGNWPLEVFKPLPPQEAQALRDYGEGYATDSPENGTRDV